MKRISLAFFWHMHQPYYHDPSTGRSAMPWVRMHAMRGYLDQIAILDRHPSIRQTFNYVPSLLKQIEQYARGEVTDVYLEHAAKPAVDLTAEEREFILWNFFMATWETMVTPYPRYRELLRMRGTAATETTIPAAARRFDARDFRDLQVWFDLAWFGHQACARFPELKEMRRRGGSFTEADKARIREIQTEILNLIIPLHRAAEARGQIELTSSPFYHPILPLLCDTDIARRAMPDVPLPARYRWPEDAEAQLGSAAAYHERLFKRKPAGLWPPEGSVCPEIVPLVARQGFRWMASDEEVLFRSIRSRDRFTVLYRPYRVEHEGASLEMVFRDRRLSDLIGFSYAHNDPRAAAADFLLKLSEIARMVPGDDALVSVILDGENPWQNYPDGGEGFLRHLYEGIEKSGFVESVRIGDYLASHPASEKITRLHSGSWIDSNFGVWIGEEEDNDAWDLLGKARAALRRREASGKARDLAAAREEIYAAEGSDWFWWYGDRFTSDNDALFDQLFRTHLRNAYALLGEEPPEALDAPIVTLGRVTVAQEPRAFLTPVIDGRETSYYEWLDAGQYRPDRAGGAMHRSEAFIKAIRYGFDEQRFLLRIDPLEKEGIAGNGEYRVHIHFVSPREVRLSFSLSNGGRQRCELSRRETPQRFGRKTARGEIAMDRVVELAVPFKDLGFEKREEVHFYVQVKSGTLEVERHPRGGYIAFTVPDEEFEIARWTAL
ncbi:MAG: glycoside hydrolase [Candidatus Aureabacteria bacterium]|nr:glycoside hydrolase [Candidatus Auribacterota bacterium]NLW93091.1 glycoside hydrolase [Chlamydiota bacterium]HQM52663.1 glycoside hydrolase family 57 protein [bacterium]